MDDEQPVTSPGGQSVDELGLLIDLHKDGARQGPGSEAATRQALDLTGLDPSTLVEVADVGCGTGASALLLARLLDARVTAVDIVGPFLDVLAARAAAQGVADRVSTVESAMERLPFAEDQFDLIWSEGAIYNIGFEQGVRDWRRFLKPGGALVVSELTWLTGTRPDEIGQHWVTEYPGIDTASAKIAQLETHGYSPVGYFTLPSECWLENYYGPLRRRFSGFLARHPGDVTARAVVDAEEREIRLYEQNQRYYSYGVYVARRV